jgi:hypothetical protein
LRYLKRPAQSWRGFLVAPVSAEHLKLAHLLAYFQVDVQLQIQQLA